MIFRVSSSILAALVSALLLSCGAEESETLEFWGLGREGQVVAELMPLFEQESGIRVNVQQIPWTAAHEKILTAHVGNSLPDVSQVGNTWVAELVTVDAIVPLGADLVPKEDYFPGIWDTNVVDGTLYAIPWYVDTRVLFYRRDLMPVPPRTWSEWLAAMDALKARAGAKDFYPIVMPTNEWPQPVIFAVQSGAVLVDEVGHARFEEESFLRGFTFYNEMFRRGFAPAVSNSQIANLYQQFGAGDFGMFISGPWDVGNLRERLTPEQQKLWTTAPLPAPDGTPWPGASLSGGSSLVIAKTSKKQESARKLIQFLSRPDVQVRFFELTNDLPARRSAWQAPELVNDEEIAAFRTQLDRTAALPRVPESENIMISIAEHGQLMVRGQFRSPGEAAEALDRKIEQMLTKRRWVLEQSQ